MKIRPPSSTSVKTKALNPFENITVDLKTTDDITQMIRHFYKIRPKYSGFDTESDGLHVIQNKAAILIFGYLCEFRKEIYTYSLDLRDRNTRFVNKAMLAIYALMPLTKVNVAHNATFDLHMLCNAGYPYSHYENLTDLTFYIRLAHDAVPSNDGGAPLPLKNYVKRFIDPNIATYERALKKHIKDKKALITKRLKENLLEFEVPEIIKGNKPVKGWTLKLIDDYFNDKINEAKDLPKNIMSHVRIWEKEIKEAEKYTNLPDELLIPYAHKDVFYTLVVLWTLAPVVKERQQEETLKRENACIQHFFEMEREGHYIDVMYLFRAKRKLRKYILQLRHKIQEIAGEGVKVGQHKRLKNYFLSKNINMASTDKKTLRIGMVHKEVPEEQRRLMRYVFETRTLEKFYSTYLMPMVEYVRDTRISKYYPTYNQAGAVTGRVSSDFQQIPKKPIKDTEGNELFHPRKLFKVPEGKYLAYLDFDAMELRILANYTILIGHGDVNLCRVFIPYRCVEKDGKYYLEENPTQEWKPIDPHGLTAKNAFNVTEDDPDFQDKRNKGKTGNFAILYGSTIQGLVNETGFSMEEATKIYNSFFKSYEGVRIYNRFVETTVRKQRWIANLFQRRYYNLTGHNAKNYIIQGSGADYTKELIVEIKHYLKGKKSKLLGYLHDEFSFVLEKDELYILKDLQAVMEQLNTPIKMTVGIEISHTNWGEKYDYDSH